MNRLIAYFLMDILLFIPMCYAGLKSQTRNSADPMVIPTPGTCQLYAADAPGYVPLDASMSAAADSLLVHSQPANQLVIDMVDANFKGMKPRFNPVLVGVISPAV